MTASPSSDQRSPFSGGSGRSDVFGVIGVVKAFVGVVSALVSAVFAALSSIFDLGDRYADVVTVAGFIIIIVLPGLSVVSVGLGIVAVLGHRIVGAVASVAGSLRSQVRRSASRTGASAMLNLALMIGGSRRAWQADDWRMAVSESPRPIRYSLGLIRAALLMRLFDLGGLLLKVAFWVLTTDRRTWGIFGPLLVAAAVNVHLSQGWGSAFFTIPGIIAFHAGVEWLRKRWGIETKPPSRTTDETPHSR